MTDRSSPGSEQLRELAQQLLDAAHYCTEQTRLECHCRDIARKLEDLADEAATPIHADIAQIISDGWRNGKTSTEVAEAVLREFDGAAQAVSEPDDPAEVWEDYLAEVDPDDRSLQGALAFGFWRALSPSSTDRESGK